MGFEFVGLEDRLPLTGGPGSRGDRLAGVYRHLRGQNPCDRIVVALAGALACTSGCAAPASPPTEQTAPTSAALSPSTDAPLAEASGTRSARVPNRPTFEPSARVLPGDLTTASAAAQASATPVECAPRDAPKGWDADTCEPREIVGGAPCELECWRRRPAKTEPCCEAPVEGALFGEKGQLLSVKACAHVSPNCAHTSTLKSTESGFHFYSDSDPREVVLVQGGCEMRAMGHGYVPDGVAAWTGCPVAQRFRWNGSRFDVVPP